MDTRGTKEYREHMAAIHDEVVRTGKPVTVTKDGKPYVRIVPAGEESVLQGLADAGVVVLPKARRRSVQPIDAGGADSTTVVAESRR